MFKLRGNVVFSALLMLTAPLHVFGGDGSEYTIRSNPTEVRIEFTAVGADGRRLEQLEPREVAVIDNEEVVRRFRSFGPASDTPLRVVILVDLSDSVSTQVVGEVQLVNAFVHSSKWGPNDQLSIAVFGGEGTTIVCDQNCRDRDLSYSIPSSSSATPLFDALVTGAELLTRMHGTPNSRGAIILLSDGADNYSVAGYGTAMSVMQAVNASVYAVNTRGKNGDGRGDAVLEQIATATGGVAYPPGRGSVDALNAVVDDLRQGFVLTYEVPHSRSVQHNIRVVPALNSRLRFRARQSYMESAKVE